MKTGQKRFLKAAGAVTMATAVAVAGAPVQGLTGVVKFAKAAGTPQDREDSSILYFVDCGDLVPETVSDGEQLGTHNSVTEQVYGEDKATGYKWGIDDTVSSPLKNGACGVGGVSTDETWPYEFVEGDNLSKTSTNRYTKNQFENGVEERHLDYKFEIENGTYYVEIGCADPWGCSQSPQVYANKGKDTEKDLSSTLNIAAAEPATGNVEVKDGELTLNFRGTGNANLAINVCYILIKEAGASSSVQADLNAISIRESVTGDISLPTQGKQGSTISWSSSNTAVIANDGTVVRPESGQESVKVTLTATAVMGEVTQTKTFEVTVLAKSDLSSMSALSLEEVTVTDPYYTNALDKEVAYLLKLDKDRLLAGFRETAFYAANPEGTAADAATFMKNKERYPGGWENALIGGHTLGHWMTAVAQGVVNAGVSEENKKALKESLDYVVSALKECQDMTVGTDVEGYIFGATLVNKKDVDVQFDNVEKNLTNIGTQAWVPWYTMHKIVAGLLSSYELTGNEEAYTVAKKLGDWIAARTEKWSDATQKTVLNIEYGGMNDCLYDLCADVKAKEGEAAAAKYEAAAHMFDEVTLFELVNRGTKDALNNKHANTTIPKYVGALKRYIVTGDAQYLEYVESFWDYVVNHHTYITGGNSEWEHFGADDILDAERTNCNCETCNTYNMLKMSRQLFMITGNAKYTDFYENTFINAIMSSQNPETGMSMYFQPMASGYHKVYGSEEAHFWCCTGSGMENFTKLNDSIYYQAGNILVVAQYLASTVDFKAGNMKLTQTGDLTQFETMTLKVEKLADGDITGSLRLRLPDWLASDASVKVNGEAYTYQTADGYALIPASVLGNGAEITITLPMQVVAYNLPDGENTYAFKYGPYVLSARLGSSKQSQGVTGVNVSISSTKAIANDRVAIRSTDSVKDYIDNITNNMARKEGSLEFTLMGTDNSYAFVPHYSQYKDSYAIYWTFAVDTEGRDSEAVITEKNNARIEKAMIEGGRPGYGQDELGFEEYGEGSESSSSPSWRNAKAGGSFKYDVKVADSGDNYLVCTFAKEEDGKTIKISVGDTVIFAGEVRSTLTDAVNINLADSDAADYYQMSFKLPADVIAANRKNTRMEGTEEKQAESRYAFLPVTFASNKDWEASAKLCTMTYVMRGFATENELTGITSTSGEITRSGDTFTLNASLDRIPKAKFEIADGAGYVALNGNAIDETTEKELTGLGSEIKVQVYAEDFKTVKEYTLKLVYDCSSLKGNLVAGYAFDDSADGVRARTIAALKEPNYAVDDSTDGAKAEASVPTVDSPSYSYTEGKSGKAIVLSGSYGLEFANTDAAKLGESYTVSYWMKPDTLGGGVDPTFVAGTFNPEYWLSMTFDAKIWSKNGDYIETTAANAYQAGEWQQVTLVVDGNTAGTVDNTVTGTLYLNGEAISTGNVAKGIMTNGGAGLYFGVNAWDAYYQGAVDEVMFFNKAFSDAEVQALASGVTVEDIGPTPGPTTPTNTNAENGEVTKVTIKAAGVKNGASSASVKKGNKLNLTSTVSGTGIFSKNGKNVKWKSSNKKVATVTAKGVVKAKKAGTVKITAVSAANASKKATFTVKVTAKAKANKALKLKKKSITLKKKGATAAIKISKMTSGTTDRISYKVTSGKSNVSVDKYGVVKAKKASGKATVKVTCGKASAVVTVKLK